MSQLCFLLAGLSGTAESMPSPRHIHNLQQTPNTGELQSATWHRPNNQSRTYYSMCSVHKNFVVMIQRIRCYCSSPSQFCLLHPNFCLSLNQSLDNPCTPNVGWKPRYCHLQERHALTSCVSPLNHYEAALLSCSWLHVLSDWNTDHNSY